MDQRESRQLAEQIDTLLLEVEQSAPPAVTERVEDLVRSLLGLYGAALGRTLELAHDAQPALVRRFADDDLLGSLLVLHDLHPDDVHTRVQSALDRVRPYLGSHAGGVELLGVDEQGVAHLRLEGSCDGCPSSAVTVSSAIEDAVLGAAPDVLAVEVEGMVSADPPLLQIQPFRGPREGGDPGWVHVDLDVPPGSVSLAHAAGEPVLVAWPGDQDQDAELVAYHDECPGCGGSLAAGALAGDVLACPGCGTRFDLRHAGRGVEDVGPRLVPFPLLREGTGWKVSVAVPVAT